MILAFALGIEEGYHGNEFHAGYFFGFLLGGPLAAFWSCLVMYGLGELIDKVSEIQKSICVSKASEKSKDPAPVAAPAPIRKSPVVGANANRIKCPVCGREQNKLRETCFGCGLEFEKDTDPKSVAKAPAKGEKGKPIACDDPSLIKCPSCGREQNKSRSVCWECGLKFETDEP